MILVTVADRRYADGARQLFGSVCRNGRWPGDYGLIGHDLGKDQIEWFTSRGVHVLESQLPIEESEWYGLNPNILAAPAAALKFHLFSGFFRRWSRALFLDADMIVDGPLTRVTRMPVPAAAADYGNLVKDFFVKPKQAERVAMLAGIDPSVVNSLGLNSGVLWIDPRKYPPSTTDELTQILRCVLPCSVFSDQTTFALHWGTRWYILDSFYNVFPLRVYPPRMGGPSPHRFNGYILHFVGSEKPWHPDHLFNERWRRGLEYANGVQSFGTCGATVSSRSRDWSLVLVRLAIHDFANSFVSIIWNATHVSDKKRRHQLRMWLRYLALTVRLRLCFRLRSGPSCTDTLTSPTASKQQWRRRKR